MLRRLSEGWELKIEVSKEIPTPTLSLLPLERSGDGEWGALLVSASGVRGYADLPPSSQGWEVKKINGKTASDFAFRDVLVAISGKGSRQAAIVERKASKRVLSVAAPIAVQIRVDLTLLLGHHYDLDRIDITPKKLVAGAPVRNRIIRHNCENHLATLLYDEGMQWGIQGKEGSLPAPWLKERIRVCTFASIGLRPSHLRDVAIAAKAAPCSEAILLTDRAMYLFKLSTCDGDASSMQLNEMLREIGARDIEKISLIYDVMTLGAGEMAARRTADMLVHYRFKGFSRAVWLRCLSNRHRGIMVEALHDWYGPPYSLEINQVNREDALDLQSPDTSCSIG